MAKKEAPLGVKIIAALYSLSAGGLIWLGISGALINGDFDTFGTFLISISVLFGLFIIWVSYNMWKGKNWARGFSIVMGSLAGIGAIMAMLDGYNTYSLIELILAGLIVYYFGFNKEVKEFFTS